MKDNKILVYVLVAVAIVFLGVYIYNYKHNDFKLITNDEELAVFMQNMKEGDLEEYLAKRDELYAKDTYGGDTPEETLGMYIEALKKGDLELASKYFKLEDQEKELSELNSFENDSLDVYISVLESFTDVFCDEDKKECDINGFFKNEDILVARVIKNKQTGKWKIESL